MRRTKHNKLPTSASFASGSFDRTLFGLTILLTVLGIIAVADASAPQALARFGDALFFVKQQAVWAVLGVVALIVGIKVHYSYWKRMSGLAFMGLIALLILVLIPGIGSEVLGARRWINLGFFSIQPSEVAKLVIALFFARLAEAKYPWQYFIGAIGLVAGFIMLQPNLGTTIIVVSIGFIQMFVAGIPLLYLLGLGGGGAVLATLLVITSDYRKQRLLTFLGVSDDPLGSSYHIRQILLALGSGGLFGVGLGQSKQKQLFLPETATDSVFAVLAEELGFVGSIIIVLLMTYFIIRIMHIAQKAPDTFSKVFVAGVAGWMGVQTFMNLAAMTALVPITGIPLPFLSYGGSSLTMIMFAIGVTLNISKHAKK